MADVRSKLQLHLGVTSYQRLQGVFQKIRASMQHRNVGYQVGNGILEIDASRL